MKVCFDLGKGNLIDCIDNRHDSETERLLPENIFLSGVIETPNAHKVDEVEGYNLVKTLSNTKWFILFTLLLLLVKLIVQIFFLMIRLGLSLILF